MARDNVTGTAVHIQRVLQDDFVQAQLRAVASGLTGAYKRARQERGRSVEDKKLYASLQQAATSGRNVVRAFTRSEPEPRHRTRRLAGVVLAIAGATALTVKLQKLDTQRRNPGPHGDTLPAKS